MLKLNEGVEPKDRAVNDIVIFMGRTANDGTIIPSYNFEVSIRELINLIDTERYQMRQDEIRQIGWKGAQGKV